MTFPAIGWLLVVLGRLIGFAAAVLTIALSVWWGSETIRYPFFSEVPTWGEVGVIPLVLVLRIVAAAWVMWGVFTFDLRQLMYLLFGVGVGSFLALFGWYFMLLGPVAGFISFDNVVYLLAVCDLLYVAAGLVVGCVLILPSPAQASSDR